MYINIDTLVISCINTMLPQYRFNIVLQLITSCILYHCKKSPSRDLFSGNGLFSACPFQFTGATLKFTCSWVQVYMQVFMDSVSLSFSHVYCVVFLVGSHKLSTAVGKI